MEQCNHIGLYVNIASHCIRRKMDSFSAPFGLSGIQVRILGFLDTAREEEHDVFQRDIEKNFGIRRSSVTSVISNLEQKGLIQRESVSGDARLKRLSLTEDGRTLNRSICHRIKELEDQMDGFFSEEERDSLIRMLQVIIDNLYHDECTRCK